MFLKIFLKNKIDSTLIRYSHFFDEQWYRSHNECPPRPEEDAVQHYLLGGWRNGDPSKAFDQRKYLEANPDVAKSEICPLLHYLTYGKIEKRKKTPDQMEVPYRRRRIIRFLKRKWYERKYSRIIRKNQDARILVIVHIYYEDAIREIVEYLKNLEKYSYDLIVTTVQSRDLERINDDFQSFKADTKIQVYDNKGYDVAPFIWALKSVHLDDYDMVFKLQSKRNFSRSGSVAASSFYVKGRDWFLYLYESIIGAGFIHQNIDRLKHQDQTDLISAKNLYMQDQPHNEHLTLAQLKKHGIDLHPGYYFVAGTCFAAKADAMKTIQELPISEDDFSTSERGYFSLAHAMERFITAKILPEACCQNNVCVIRQRIRRLQGREKLKYNGIRVSLDPSFELDDEFVFRFLAPATIYRYEMANIALGSLSVTESGKRVPVEQSATYQYLCDRKDGTPESRTNFEQNGERKNRDDGPEDLNGNDLARLETAIRRIEKEEYDEHHPIVVLDQGEIVNGLHWVCWLLLQEGPSMKCKVLCLHTRKNQQRREGMEQRR